ncbi:exodeoxyribonuclease V subunit alpha [Endozoicomonas sp. Mp262]|uniref:exodeoxyribonuclease V subunit alpha n=1 Tax=Endozoicomonas sp. Mp262 TaxID=2919499 RepID=UPI0021DA9F11
MLELLKQLAHDRQIRPLDYQFARFINSLNNDKVLTLASALVSHQLGLGNVCLSLKQISHDRLFGLNKDLSLQLAANIDVDIPQWSDYLQQLPEVGEGSQPTPLVIDNQRLYLYRYWQYETQVAHYLNSRNSIKVEIPAASLILDRLFRRDYHFILGQCQSLQNSEAIQQALIKWLDIEDTKVSVINWESVVNCISVANSGSDLKALDKHIPGHCCLNWQKISAALATTRNFSVISGGPGTGKTTTVTRLLALLVELSQAKDSTPIIKLVAPTGKAAARLTESIGSARLQLDCTAEVKNTIPAEAGTLHRLLGVLPGRPGFKHNRNNPLHLDILVIDEASMIDLPLMSRLLEALPSHARLILIGDRDQLASVEAGSVLGDICAAAGGGYSPDQTRVLEQLTGFDLSEHSQQDGKAIHNSLCLLQKSYRFDARSGIGSLANAVNTGNLTDLKRTLSRGFSDITLHPMDNDKTGYPHLINLCVRGYQQYLSLIQAGEQDRNILKAFNRFQLLCALREGRYGVVGLNQAIRSALAYHQLVDAEGIWYPGRPVLISRNDYALGLFNGDIGITLKDSDGRLRVVFELPDGTLKHLIPSRLPEHETVFAMTVHKSQGSEFEHTVMVLPEQFNPVVTRELVYTGITRAKKKLDLFCSSTILTKAIKMPTERVSGLKERL